MQLGLGTTYNMNAAELEIVWPLFLLALLASSSSGAGGEADPPRLTSRSCCALQSSRSCG